MQYTVRYSTLQYGIYQLECLTMDVCYSMIVQRLNEKIQNMTVVLKIAPLLTA